MRTMVELLFGGLTTLDLVMAITTGVIGGIVLLISYKMTMYGIANWKARKTVHITMGTIIALTALRYSNLSGPFLAAGIFLTILVYAWAHKSNLITILLVAGTRESETRFNTFASGLMGLAGFSIAFMLSAAHSSVFVAAILAVAWGDAAGEVIGRSIGGKYVQRKYRKKSFEGTLGVFMFGILSVLIALLTQGSQVCPLCVFPQILLVASVIALTEAFSIGWSDNFLIPILTAVVMISLIFPADWAILLPI
jgi:dolichol kinase